MWPCEEREVSAIAFVVFVDGKTATLKPEQALAVWHVLNGDKEPENDKQDAFCCRVKRLYLNRENAPESYLRKFPTGYDVPAKAKKEVWYQK